MSQTNSKPTRSTRQQWGGEPVPADQCKPGWGEMVHPPADMSNPANRAIRDMLDHQAEAAARVASGS